MASPYLRNTLHRRKNSSPDNTKTKKYQNPLEAFWAEKERPNLTDDKVEIERLKTIILSNNEKLKVF